MIARLFALLLGLVGAVTLAQFPEFAQQYAQRLGGRLDELRGFVERFDADARRAGLERRQALAEFGRSGSAFLDHRGQDAAHMIDRFERYDAVKRDLEAAAPIERLAVFVRTIDKEVARATLDDFQPAVPATAEGALHAGLGFLIGLLLSSLLIGRQRSAASRRTDLT